MMRTKTILVAAGLALLVGGACGSDGDSSAPTSSVTSTTEDGDTTTSDGATSSPSSTSATSATTTTTTATSTSDSPQTTLPGEDIFSFAEAGDIIGVMGVAHDDQLNVRDLPGADQAIIATIGPTADDLVATGRARLLPGSIWYEIASGTGTGWVNSRFVAFVGGTDDMTAEFLAGRERPEAETMTALGEFVAAELGSEEPKSRIVQTVAAAIGDLGEVTYDVIGLGDDSVGGFRLHVFAVQEQSGEDFVLRTIERTVFCSRGLAGELCV